MSVYSNMPIQHITELFVLDGRDFVTEAYRNLLGREPDAHGVAYYLGRMAQGYGKGAVIAQVARSPECRPVDEIKGLAQLVADERRARHWFWGLFGRRRHLEQTLQSSLNALAQHNHQQLAWLQDAMNTHTQGQTQGMSAIAEQIEALSRQAAQWQAVAMASNPTQAPHEALKLSAETVRQAFMDILGREPESDEAIKHHQRMENAAALRENLMTFEEFKSKLAALPEYARSIYMHQIHMLAG